MPLSILPAPCTLSALVQFGHPAAQYIQKAWICLRFRIWHLDSTWWESGFKDTKPMDKPYKQTKNQAWIVIIHEKHAGQKWWGTHESGLCLIHHLFCWAPKEMGFLRWQRWQPKLPPRNLVEAPTRIQVICAIWMFLESILLWALVEYCPLFLEPRLFISASCFVLLFFFSARHRYTNASA